MTMGPDDPCPCGSGKPYEACCRSAGFPAAEVALHYQRLSKSYETLEEHLGEHAYRIFGQDGPAVALEEFLGWPEGDEPVGADFLDRQGALFWPWFLFNWEYKENEFELDGPRGKTVAELYMEDQGLKADATEQQLIYAINRKPYGFWEVMGVVAGTAIDFRDILTGARIMALEKTGSHTVEPGDIVFGRVVLINDVGMIFGIGATILPPEIKAQLDHFQQSLQGKRQSLTDADLLDRQVQMRRLYFDMEQSILDAPVPAPDEPSVPFH